MRDVALSRERVGKWRVTLSDGEGTGKEVTIELCTIRSPNPCSKRASIASCQADVRVSVEGTACESKGQREWEYLPLTARPAV